ncbi:MAG: hypothetical protein IJ419_08355 [Agathobacter sp.]|nr:hypothetical protein [Agathobacter sp.]
MVNKNEFNARIAELVKIYGRPCVKLEMDNLILPPWATFGVFGRVHAYSVKTSEAPKGHQYNPAEYQTVVRFVDGRVLFDRKDVNDETGEVETVELPDGYAWKQSKVLQMLADGAITPIGTSTPEAILNMVTLLNTIKDDAERAEVAATFASFGHSTMLAHSDAENRVFIRVTQELYDAGLTYSADEWLTPDANGMVAASNLFVGDVVIVTTNADGSITGYRIDEELFELTHTY